MAKPTQQHTGNHKRPGSADAGGADRFGGTRAGAQNVEPKSTIKPSKGTTRSPADRDMDRAGGIRPGRSHPKTSEAGGVD
jgi:hypothetical protein